MIRAHAEAHPTRRLSGLDGLAAMVGRTPLVEVVYRSGGRLRRLYAKYEQKNMTGSIKDRMALWILREAYRSGELHPGDTIAEATSGNTGISFAAMGRALGHPVKIFMPDWMSRERVALILSMGAEVIPVSREQGGFKGSITLADEFARGRPDVFLPHQFCNPANADAHELTTGPEIAYQVSSVGRSVDALVAGVGTGGTVMGVGRCLRSLWPDVRLHPLEPANSPTLRTGNKSGTHRIQGISDEFIPDLVHLHELDSIVDVWDGDAIAMAQCLGKAGLAVGISSGANFLGADQVLDDLGDDATVVTVFPDSNKKYLSTDLAQPVEPDDRFRSPFISILSWRAIPCDAPVDFARDVGAPVVSRS
jgi:cysteine synthase